MSCDSRFHFTTEHEKNQWLKLIVKLWVWRLYNSTRDNEFKIYSEYTEETKRNLEGGFKDFISLFIDSLSSTWFHSQISMLLLFHIKIEITEITVFDDLFTKICTSAVVFWRLTYSVPFNDSFNDFSFQMISFSGNVTKTKRTVSCMNMNYAGRQVVESCSKSKLKFEIIQYLKRFMKPLKSHKRPMQRRCLDSILSYTLSKIDKKRDRKTIENVFFQ